ncbi:ABC transporter substrate-binding protein [Arthrobacter luteolus]|uniref:ABC transporter substrate-binding protein n=1 Tax=Arthrobacter luteolus TaxID=98672 RepID=UPI00082AB0E6|nr:sugar ABC transporter substrate-binding protein [Arthrobacter luteolus]
MASSRYAPVFGSFLRTGTALGVLALALASCSGAPAAGQDGAGSFEGQELNLLLITSHEGASEWLSQEFEKKTGAKINPTIVPYDEIGSTLALDQQSGANQFDVAAPWYVSIGDLAADESIKDLTEWIEGAELDTEDFIPSIYDPYTLVDDRRYGLPFDGDTHVLFYNTEVLARNGFDTPPATWDEYLEQSRTITENEGAAGTYGAAVFGQKSPLILGASYANRLAGFGGSFVDGNGKPTINTPAAVAAAENLVESAKYAYPTAAETDFGVGNGAWFDGKVGFIENWTDLGVGSELNEDSKVAGKWGVTTLPLGGAQTEARASLVAGFTWVIAENTEKEDLAREFIAWASSSEVNEALLTADPPTGIDPNRQSSLESESYGSAYPELQEVNRTTLSGTLAWPTGKNANQAAQILTDELAKLLAGQGGTAKETLDRVQAEWEQILG